MTTRSAPERRTFGVRAMVSAHRQGADGDWTRLTALQLVACAGLFSACGDPLVSPDRILDTRVLGARVEAATDPTLSSVAPTEAATLHWLVAGPEGPPAVGWSISLCVAAPVVRDLPICASPSFVHANSTGVTASEPQIEFTMPDEATLQGAEQVTANAAFCRSGTPTGEMDSGDPTRTRCPDPAETPVLATMGIGVARDGVSNHNPTFAGVSSSFDAVSWAGWTEPITDPADCSSYGDALPLVRTDATKHSLVWSFPTDQSEALPTTTTHSQARETIQLSHYVTAGHLDRVFSIVDWSTPTTEVTVTWQAPSTAPATGLVVRFYFVLRDGRDGADWTTRALCVVPE